MNKKTTPTDTTPNPWDEADNTVQPVTPDAVKSTPKKPELELRIREDDRDFDIEGLMTDFPTARDLERFVYDETGVVLNLKGRANKLKYQIAMDVLNGTGVEPKFIGTDNPYLEKTDLVPEDPMKELPPRDPGLPPLTNVQNTFFTAFVPHSDPGYHAQGRRMHCLFRKYQEGVITYEIIGPIEPKPEGEKLDKWGKLRPEIIRWVDPRTGEQIVQRADGSFTPIGRRLKAMMQTMRYNNTNQWLKYIDRDFITLDRKAAINPWNLE